MTKKAPFDLMKWWPLLTAIISLISMSAVLLYRMDSAEKRLEHIGEWCQRLNQGISDLNVQCAKLGSR